MSKADVLAFLKTKKHAVISTYTSNEYPESALIGFGETEQLELIFGTYRTSRKYRNLKTNNKVALVIGWDEDMITVQYEGIASELSEAEQEKYVSLYHKKVPGAAVFKDNPEQTYWKVTPSWIRYSDLSGNEEKIVTLDF